MVVGRLQVNLRLVCPITAQRTQPVELRHAAAGDPDALQVGPKNVTQRVRGQTGQQLPELIRRNTVQLPGGDGLELAILDLRHFADEFRLAQLNAIAQLKRPAMASQHVGAQLTGQHRPYVTSGGGIDARRAHETFLHSRQMVDDDLHGQTYKCTAWISDQCCWRCSRTNRRWQCSAVASLQSSTVAGVKSAGVSTLSIRRSAISCRN